MAPAPDEAVERTARREYVIYGGIPDKELPSPELGPDPIAWRELAVWRESTPEAALRGWGNDNPKIASKHIAIGFRVVTLTSQKTLDGAPEQRFVVRARPDTPPS